MNESPITLTPTQLVAAFDKYIIGQETPKKRVAIAFRERWRRGNTSADMRDEIIPNNILMKGSTGTGKTELGRRLAKLSNVPFVKVEATEYTERGYVGGDVKTMIHELALQAFNMVKKQQQAHLEPKAHQLVENTILDTLIPPLNHSATDKEVNQATREGFRQKIRKGELDGQLIEITLRDNATMEFNNSMVEAQIFPIHDMLNKFMPTARERRKRVTIKEAKQLLLEQQLNLLMDIESLKEQAVKKAEEGIVFIDEIDKIVGSPVKGGSPDISREGVQRNLLPIVEGTTVYTRYGPIKTDHILFIAAGAFHNSKVSDLMPELQGRFPVRVEFHSLTQDDLYHILATPKNSLIKQQHALLAAEGVSLEFTEEAKRETAKFAAKINQEQEDIGARRLRTVVMHILEDYLFDVPEKYGPGTKLTIDGAFVRARLEPLAQAKEGSRYIL